MDHPSNAEGQPVTAVVEIDNLEEALARIVELEAELTKLRARPKRATKTPPTFPCQYCGDAKVEKDQFLGLPTCRVWRPCAGRIRRKHLAGQVTGYAYDRRFTVRLDQTSAEWVGRFEGVEFGRGSDRGALRLQACDMRDALAAEQLAVSA